MNLSVCCRCGRLNAFPCSFGIYAYASSSCFIFLNSSLVMFPSPSPSRCNFSRDASKSGRGGQGGIYTVTTTAHTEQLNHCHPPNIIVEYSRCSQHNLHSPRNDRAAIQILRVDAQRRNHLWHSRAAWCACAR